MQLTSAHGAPRDYVVMALIGVWAALGIWIFVTRDNPSFDLPRFVWAAGYLGGVIVWLARWWPRQNFGRRTWQERRVEIGHVLSMHEPASREWGVWVLAIVAGIPCAAVGIAVGEPAANRLGVLLVLAVCTLVGWVGLKALDARIARRMPDDGMS